MVAGPRVRGLPPSANGASSMHLWWEVRPGEPVMEVAATLEVLEPPVVPRLYFWAVQATFHDGRSATGAGHLGLQWGVGEAPRRCVNWGGYHAGGGELDGTVSALPATLGNPNTRDFPWAAGRPYRLRIRPSPAGPGLWRGEVTDMGSGATTAVRDLRCDGGQLVGPVVWSEVFARCDDPSVAVRWRQLEVVTASGRRTEAATVVAGYQRREDGGCDNTTAGHDGAGWLQRTNSPRQVPPGSRLSRPAGPPP